MGKTNSNFGDITKVEKHPHGRGEDGKTTVSQSIIKETPPRAWGRLLRVIPERFSMRNTPTGVGKTFIFGHNLFGSEKHPHGRGEDLPGKFLTLFHLETPPRAWGRQYMNLSSLTGLRNTPTGVGKTNENFE